MRLTRIFMVIALIMSFSVIAHAIQLSFYTGEVKILRNGKHVRVSTGIELLSGDVIQTGASGLAEIVYGDNSRIIVRENSRVRIGTASIKGSEGAALILGRLTGKFEKLADGSRRLYSGTAVCAIRGTELDISAADNGDALVQVKEGEVLVENASGRVILKRGEQAESNVSEKPEKGKQAELAAWLDSKEKELDKNPEECADKYNAYLKNLELGSGDDGAEIDRAEKMVGAAKTGDDLSKAGKAVESAEDGVEDNIMLAETAAQALEMIAGNFRKANNKIYLEFEKTKNEADRVAEVHRRSLADIQTLKDEFKKTYERIMGDYRGDSEKFIKGADVDSVKPEIKKY